MTKYRNGLVTISSIRGAAPTTPQGCALTEGDVPRGERLVCAWGGVWGEIGEVLGERDWDVLGERLRVEI
jgi:hypothetical protein